MDGFHYYKKQLEEFNDPSFVVYRRGAPYTFNSKKLLDKLKEVKSGAGGVVKFPSFAHSEGDPV